MKTSNRIQNLPPYIFNEINEIKKDALKRGISLLSLAVGDPDLPTPQVLVDKMRESVAKPANHAYSPYEGSASFRQSVQSWFKKRFGVVLDSEKEIIALIGSKEGIAHFPLVFCNPGDKALHPVPGYPIFENCLHLAGAAPISIPLSVEDNFLPKPEVLESLLKTHQPKMMILNFPSNPTSVMASKEELKPLVDLAKKYQCLIAYDNAYSEVYYDENKKPCSILEVEGAKDIAIEFHSFSKTFQMTGWRIGFAVGNEELVKGLLKIKTNIDSGPFLAAQETASFGLENYQTLGPQMRDIYRPRKNIMAEGLKKLGIEYINPDATFFIWARSPLGLDSMTFCKKLIEKEGIVITPGIGFGKEGEGFFRMSLTVNEKSIEDFLTRLERFQKSF